MAIKAKEPIITDDSSGEEGADHLPQGVIGEVWHAQN
jgi:hypothetical protein